MSPIILVPRVRTAHQNHICWKNAIHPSPSELIYIFSFEYDYTARRKSHSYVIGHMCVPQSVASFPRLVLFQVKIHAWILMVTFYIDLSRAVDH